MAGIVFNKPAFGKNKPVFEQPCNLLIANEKQMKGFFTYQRKETFYLFFAVFRPKNCRN